MMRNGKDHTREDWVTLSSTKVREMLSKGIAPSPEFSRPEVARFLSSLSAAARSSVPG
jgi:sulfate adenylyltransferase